MTEREFLRTAANYALARGVRKDSISKLKRLLKAELTHEELIAKAAEMATGLGASPEQLKTPRLDKAVLVRFQIRPNDHLAVCLDQEGKFFMASGPTQPPPSDAPHDQIWCSGTGPYDITEEQFNAVARSYALEHETMQTQLHEWLPIFRAKIAEEQLIVRATVEAMKLGWSSEHLANAEVDDAVIIQFGNQPPDCTAVCLDRKGGCGMGTGPGKPMRCDASAA